MRLGTKLFVLFVVITSTSSGVVFPELHSHQRLIIENAEWEVERQADSTAVQLDERLNASKRTLTVAATRPDASDHGTDAQTAYLDSLLETASFNQLLPLVVAFATPFGLVAWAYRNDIEQIEAFLDGVSAPERRQYDTELDLTGSNEWAQLEAAVSRLSATLAERETMLLVLNRLLHHDLRNSLNVIQGRAGLLRDATDDPAQRQNADVIHETSEELIRLSEKARTTEQLLVPPSGVDTGPVDLVDVARRIVEEFRERNATVAFHLTAPDTAPVRAGHEVATAVEELLENALTHAGPDPRIDVTVEWRGDATELRVADDGTGIPADEREFDIESGDGTTVVLRFDSAAER